MNEWQCDVSGCGIKAVGVGGAVGLRAIGWQFVRGEATPPVTRCPAHRTDLAPIPCRYNLNGEDPPPLCPVCAAEAQAEKDFPAQLEGRTRSDA